MSLPQVNLLLHIQDECDYLISNSGDITLDEFINDPTLKRSFARSLEIIGEATKKLPSELTSLYGEIPWREVARMRDLLIHHYFGVDYEIVWDVVVNEIPKLQKIIIQMISDQKNT